MQRWTILHLSPKVPTGRKGSDKYHCFLLAMRLSTGDSQGAVYFTQGCKIRICLALCVVVWGLWLCVFVCVLCA